MNLLDIIPNGHSYKRAGNTHGGEYHGPCPACGGTDRFHIWPGQGDHGTFWCRTCGLAGDAIEYLMKIDGLSFPAACKQLGKELPENEEYQAPHFKRPASASENFTPRVTVVANELWVQHATKLVDWAHSQLLGNQTQLDWLAARGLDLEAVLKYRLGWNAGEKGKDLYRVRSAWGLPEVLKDDGKAKKLWLPAGLVIPYYFGSTLQRIRIRRPEGEPRYYLVPGSNMSPMILGNTSRAFVIVESELDAILVHHLVGDLAGAISQGNSTAKPDEAAAAVLGNSLSILVALDSDDAGMTASLWWKKHYAQAERWPVPVGKDPGDAYKAGVNIREWIKEGLPPVLTLPKIQGQGSRVNVKLETSAHESGSTCPLPLAPCPSDSQDNNSGAGFSAATSESERAPTVHVLTAQDGRTFHITDDAREYAALVAAGAIVFDSREIALVKKATDTPEQAAHFLNLKKTFPGIRITEVHLDVTHTETRPQANTQVR